MNGLPFRYKPRLGEVTHLFIEVTSNFSASSKVKRKCEVNLEADLKIGFLFHYASLKAAPSLFKRLLKKHLSQQGKPHKPGEWTHLEIINVYRS